MIIYNITTQVSWEIHDNWRNWIISRRIPALHETGLFSQLQLVRVLEVNEEDGPMYALQLYLKPGKLVDDLRKNYLPRFEIEDRNQWGDEIFSFSSLMEVIN